MTGVIELVSQLIGTPDVPFWAQTLVTRDGGSSWISNIDTAFVRVYYGDLVQIRDEHLVIASRLTNTTFHSDDFGANMEMIRGDITENLDILLTSPATQFRAVAFRDAFQKVDIQVSYDSGATFSLLTTLADTSYHVHSFKFKDSNEFWAVLGPRTDIKPLKRGKVLYSKDHGLNWTEVFPFDTIGTDWASAQFGIGTSFNGNEGLMLGKTPGTVYLINCVFKPKTPEHRHYGLLVTTDYGLSWRGDTTQHRDGYPYTDISLLRNSRGSELWQVSADSQTLGYSSDNGISWMHDSVTFRGNNIVQMLWKDSTHAYALSFTKKDSILTFWKYTEGSSHVEHLDNPHNRYFRMPSSLLLVGKIRVYALQPIDGEMAVYDVLGRLIWSKAVKASASEKLELDVPNTTGVFILAYTGGQGKQSERYIRQ
jgi:photosystem II stability/assembly factor-like uncharacterized protein